MNTVKERAMAEIPDAMVERALDAMWGGRDWQHFHSPDSHRAKMRAALAKARGGQ